MRLQVPLGMTDTRLLYVTLAFILVASALRNTPLACAETSNEASFGPPGIQQSESAKEEGARSYILAPEKYGKVVAYSRARNRLYFLGVGYSLVVLLVILVLGIAPKFRAMAEAVSRRRFVQALVFAPLLLLTLNLLDLPIDIYRQHLAREYNQSVQTWGPWLGDWTKGVLINIAILTILTFILYGVIRRSVRRWWFYFWLAAMPIFVFVVIIQPVVIEPRFSKFEPLEAKHPALYAEIQRVAARGGLQIPSERILVMKASEKRKSVNASVRGFGPSKRVVVWDTTIARMTTPQLLFCFGHEMGHDVLGHVPRGLAFFIAGSLAILFLIYRGMHWVMGRWGAVWGMRGIEDWASLPVFMLFLTLFTFLGKPITNTFNRWVEHEADIYGLEVTHGMVPDAAQAAAEYFQIAGEINLREPSPNRFIKIWLYDHPPISERIALAREYDPWSKGQPTRFVRQQ